MTQAETKTQALLARLAVVLIVALSALGLIWYGFSAEVQQRIWRDIFDRPGGPMMFRFIYNLRTDPFERADITSNTYWDWYCYKGYMIIAAQALVTPLLATFKEFPPRQKAASFTIDQAMQKMEESLSGAQH